MPVDTIALLEAFDAFLLSQGVTPQEVPPALGVFKTCRCNSTITCQDILECVGQSVIEVTVSEEQGIERAMEALTDAHDSGSAIKLTLGNGTFTLTESLRLPSFTCLAMMPGTILELANGVDESIITNWDWAAGNTAITILGNGALLDGNNANQAFPAADGPGPSGVAFVNVSDFVIDWLRIIDPALHCVEVGPRTVYHNPEGDPGCVRGIISRIRGWGYQDDGITSHWSTQLKILSSFMGAPNDPTYGEPAGYEIDDSCEDVLVANCSYNGVVGGDSGGNRAIVVKGHGVIPAPAKNVSIVNFESRNATHAALDLAHAGATVGASDMTGVQVANFRAIWDANKDLTGSNLDVGVVINGAFDCDIMGLVIDGAKTGVHQWNNVHTALPDEGIRISNFRPRNISGDEYLVDAGGNTNWWGVRFMDDPHWVPNEPGARRFLGGFDDAGIIDPGAGAALRLIDYHVEIDDLVLDGATTDDRIFDIEIVGRCQSLVAPPGPGLPGTRLRLNWLGRGIVTAPEIKDKQVVDESTGENTPLVLMDSYISTNDKVTLRFRAGNYIVGFGVYANLTVGFNNSLRIKPGVTVTTTEAGAGPI